MRRYLTPRQRAIVREQYPLNKTRDEINAIFIEAGELPANVDAITKYANGVGLRKGGRKIRADRSIGLEVDINATEDDYAPVIAPAARVAAYAQREGLRFRDWDDLPGVNDHRFRHDRPPFCRLLRSMAA